MIGEQVMVPRARSLPEQVAEWLSEEILREELAPGERITETAIAERFGVSRGPVRDALKLLEQDGLVRIFPRRGVIVSGLDVHEISEIFMIRAVLGGLAARLMVETAPPDVLGEFARRARSIESLVDDRDRFFEEASALSDLMGAWGGGGQLARLMKSLRKQVQRARFHAFGERKIRKLTADLFDEVADAIESGNPETARTVVERMGERLRKAIVDFLHSQESE